MTGQNFSQNSMTFPEIPENFKIPEIPWFFHYRGNSGTAALHLHHEKKSAYKGCKKPNEWMHGQWQDGELYTLSPLWEMGYKKVQDFIS